jgi:hypothetical protein
MSGFGPQAVRGDVAHSLHRTNRWRLARFAVSQHTFSQLDSVHLSCFAPSGHFIGGSEVRNHLLKTRRL